MAKQIIFLAKETFWPTELWGRFSITTQVVECKKREKNHQAKLRKGKQNDYIRFR